MNRLKLCLAIHDHQPVGNFPEIFRRAFEQSYGPFVAALERHPAVRLSLHCTGPLLEWFEACEPAFLERLGALVARGQVEILGGGFYEPILAVLPERDAIAQIERMRAFCVRKFGVAPQGAWLAERAWEPDLPRVLAAAGVRFTLLDDTAFLQAGLAPEELTGHFLTEKAGAAVALFPIDRRLRYLVPFREPEEVLGHLRTLRDRGATSVTYGDDGEKFGLWPGTAEWVFERGWLERFFAALEQSSDWLALAHFEEAVADPPAGRVYLPTASYEEMMEWTLPARAQATYEDFRQALAAEGRLEPLRPYVRGGIWQGFLAKYPEANALHKKMLLVSERVARAERVAEAVGTAAARHRAAEARTALLRGQCNDAYWHGLFGGLYARHLRGAAYRELLRAEALADALLPGEAPLRVERRDYDVDGHEEILLSSPYLCAYVAPARGGAVVELDHVPSGVNLCDVLARRVEGYHRKVPAAGVQRDDAPASIHDVVRAKEADLARFLVADRHGRHAFIEHLLEPESTFDELAAGRPREVATLATGPWRLDALEHDPTRAVVRMAREAGPARVVKAIDLELPDRIAARYEIEATGERRGVLFASEISFALPAEDPAHGYLEIDGVRKGVREPGRSEPPASLRAVDEHTRLQLTFRASWPAEVWRIPIETVSQSEDGFERTFQGCALLFLWKGMLSPGEPQRLEVAIEVRALP